MFLGGMGPLFGTGKVRECNIWYQKARNCSILICICEKGKNMVKDVSMSQTEDRLCILKKHRK